jgi:acyl carrier protein
MGDITQELTNLVAKTLKVSPDQLRPEADLVTDLGADSLAVVELMMALEERLGVRIDDAEVEGIRTFGDALSLVRAKLAA